MSDPFAQSAIDTVRHYLDQIEHLLQIVAGQDDPQALLDIKLAPDMFSAGFNFAVALGFSARPMPASRARDASLSKGAYCAELVRLQIRDCFSPVPDLAC